MSKFIINTCDEEKFNELQKEHKIDSNQLYIIDDNDTNRTVIPTLDYLNTKLKDLNLNKNCTLGELFEYIHQIKNVFSK